MQKRDMQKIVLKILVESKRNMIPYLTRDQIVEKVKVIKPKVRDLDEKVLENRVSQTLYLLKIKKHRKWNAPKVIKEEDGWTIEETF